MQDRRSFLKALGGVTAGMYLAGPAFAQGRKEVMIGDRRIRVVDIHYHAHIPAVMDVIRGTEFERNIGGSRNLGPERIPVMDSRGIDVFFVTIGGADARRSHLIVMSAISKVVLETNVLKDLREAESPEAVIEVLEAACAQVKR